MKKVLLAFLITILVIPFVLAQNIELEKTEISQVIIVEIGNPIEYILKINNLGERDTFSIYSRAGFEIEPKEIEIGSNEVQSVRIKAHASENRLRTTRGEFVFDFTIKGSNSEITDKLGVSMIELKDLLDISIDNINPQSEEATIRVENNERINIENINLVFKSPFFEFEKNLSLEQYGRTSFTAKLNEAQKNRLVAGNYLADFNIQFRGEDAKIEVPFNYLEKEGLAVSESSKGFIIREKVIEKINTGNTPVTASISESINILSRLFTTLSQKPSSTEKQGFIVTYHWEKELAPSEILRAEIKTNYTFPFILILLIIVVAISVKIYLDTNLKVKKHVSFVKTKGDEFAMRVRLNIKAKKNLKNIEITDRIPTMTKLYDKFGIKPNVIDAKTRTLKWQINHLNAGETRVFSYIIYSKIKIVGRIDLPSAIASYESNGKKMQSFSNTTSLATETTERSKMAEDFI